MGMVQGATKHTSEDTLTYKVMLGGVRIETDWTLSTREGSEILTAMLLFKFQAKC